MTSPSPSEFLTFYRRLTATQCLRHRKLAQLPRRQFAVSSIQRASTSNPNAVTDSGTQHDTGAGEGEGASREHAVDKGNKKDPNLQSYEATRARDAKAEDTGGQAVRQADERNSTARAKKDHPEAPDVVIGMQDERGGKGA
ncbi:hypothetical protein BAUCODRAFT_31657 [Baudoinia panamericana UAMH 10762]|uniref:Uncharacterized protein n=1 Tax=Baudoinia panamericana (strain UAMH 10762) TaxID=717646 RepID=M2MR76_BAUPA|nr:uncharacterized protein BAUCODRAFT_31657 [Baudoinia panamericana UAMH 10762]EMC99341.1 hypothetical protein BAUCODRAFT_31657 [Baudoinia panamericana UAMH 10762]